MTFPFTPTHSETLMSRLFRGVFKSLKSLHDILPPLTEIFHEQLWMLGIWKDMISFVGRWLSPPTLTPSESLIVFSQSENSEKECGRLQTPCAKFWYRESIFLQTIGNNMHVSFMKVLIENRGNIKTQNIFLWMTFPSSWLSLKVS